MSSRGEVREREWPNHVYPMLSPRPTEREVESSVVCDHRCAREASQRENAPEERIILERWQRGRRKESTRN